jgi:hypothetical protein
MGQVACRGAEEGAVTIYDPETGEVRLRAMGERLEPATRADDPSS